jgi:hypothetical protein
MESKRKGKVFNNTLQGSRLTGRPRNRLWNCVKKVIINAKLQTGKGGQKAEQNGRSPLKTLRFEVDSTAIKEKEDANAAE